MIYNIVYTIVNKTDKEVRMVKRAVLALLVLLVAGFAFAEGQVEIREVEVPVETIVEEDRYPLAAYEDVPEMIGMIRDDAKGRLSLEQQRVVTHAYRRVFQEHLDSEYNPGLPYNDDLVHFWWGRDVDTYMLSQNVGVDGDSTGEGWGMPGLAIIAMHPTQTQAFVIADEFLDLFHAGRDDEHGGNGPDGFGYPISDVYHTETYKAQNFSKGIMIVEEGEAEFIPEPAALEEVPAGVGAIREDLSELYPEGWLASISEAFVREYQQAMLREFNLGVPYNDDQVHEWAGRDAAPVTQNFNGDSMSDDNNWGMPGLAIMAMNPGHRRAYIIKDEFLVQYSTGRDDDYGGNGPDGYGAPLANEYVRFGYRAQPFEKGLMILEDGEMTFIPFDE
jgi:hypothetical protein